MMDRYSEEVYTALNELMSYSSNLQPAEEIFEMANSKKSSTMSGSEIGYSGIDITSGQIDWEYQQKLMDPKNRMGVYRKMRADGSVDCALTLIELPYEGQTIWIEPADNSNNSQMQADFVRDTFLEPSSISSTYSPCQHLQEESKMFWFGYSLFEIVLQDGDWIQKTGKKKSNMKILKKLAYRYPTSIRNWLYNVTSDVGLDGVEQELPSGDISAKYQNVSSIIIPMEKLLIYTNSKIGENWEGISVLRPVYKHWTYKDGFYKLEAIGIQKNAMSIPVLYMSNPTTERVSYAYKLMRSFMANEEAGIVLQQDKEKMDVYNGGISTVAIHRSIAHHDSKILQTVLAGFMLLGQESRGGAYNLGTSLMDFFMMSLDSKIKYSCDIKNRFLIPKLIDANWTNVRQYPKVRAYSGRVNDKKTMASILDILAKNLFVNPSDRSLREYVHTLFGLPYSEEIQEAAGKSTDNGITEEETTGAELSIREHYPVYKSKDKFTKFRGNWLKMMNALTDRQKKVISIQAHDLIKAGMVPNVNFLNTPYMGVYQNLLVDYADEMERCYGHSLSRSEIEALTSEHDLEIRSSVVKGLIKIAREQGTVV